MSFVLDASSTIAALRSPEPGTTLQIAKTQSVWVPNLWRLEVGHALTRLVRARHVNTQQRDAYLLLLSNLQITVDDQTDLYAWSDTLVLSDTHGLSLYDAAYLELAIRKKCSLATLDQQLERAALRAGVSILRLG